MNRAQQAGLTHVLIKVADGRSSYDGDLTELVTALREADAVVWAWQYTYGSHPAEEFVQQVPCPPMGRQGTNDTATTTQRQRQEVCLTR